MHVIRVVSVVLIITVYFLLHSALGSEKVLPQKIFATAEDAAKALGAAYKSGEQKAVAQILGDKGLRLVSSGDPVIDRYERAWSLSPHGEGHRSSWRIRSAPSFNSEGKSPYPIPIVKKGKGWRFDPSEGHEDLLSRRISKAELSALDVVVAYVDAQREYFRQDHDGDGVS